MKKKKPITSVSEAKRKLIFTSTWYAFAILCGALGLYVFLSEKTFGNWLLCGLLCCFPIVGVTVKNIVATVKDGYRRGANSYTVSVSSDSVSVENHPFREAVISLIIGILISLAAGPILLVIYMLLNIFDMVAAIKYLVANKKQNV